MGQVINLRRARKDRARIEARAQGDAAAAKHGRTKADRALQATACERAERHLDGHEVERSDDA